MEAFNNELVALVARAKLLRNTFPCLKSPASSPAMDMAHELAVLGQDFVKLSIDLKQAARREAESQAMKRRTWTPPRMNAERAAEALRRRGACDL